MSERKELIPDTIIDCNICLMEVPISEANSEEATDYVLHFCGLECYTRWRNQDEPIEH